jgi:hypothetical protein
METTVSSNTIGTPDIAESTCRPRTHDTDASDMPDLGGVRRELQTLVEECRAFADFCEQSCRRLADMVPSTEPQGSSRVSERLPTLPPDTIPDPGMFGMNDERPTLVSIGEDAPPETSRRPRSGCVIALHQPLPQAPDACGHNDLEPHACSLGSRRQPSHRAERTDRPGVEDFEPLGARLRSFVRWIDPR